MARPVYSAERLLRIKAKICHEAFASNDGSVSETVELRCDIPKASVYGVQHAVRRSRDLSPGNAYVPSL